MHEVLVNRLGGLSLPRKSVVRLTDRPDMTLDVYCGRKPTIQQLHKMRNLSSWGMHQLEIFHEKHLCQKILYRTRYNEESFKLGHKPILNISLKIIFFKKMYLVKH